MSQDFDGIPLESLEACRVAALLGESFSLQVLMEVGVEARWLDPLFDREVLLQDNATHASFADFAFHEKLLSQIPWSFRRAWSLKLADCLEKKKGEPGKLGELFLSAQAFNRARPHLIRAAELACLANEYSHALALLRRVFEIWDEEEGTGSRPRLLREMARCAANGGDHETAVIAWEELLEIARGEEDLAGQITAHRHLAGWAEEAGNRNRSREHLKVAAELGSLSSDPDLEARQWFDYAGFQLTHVRLSSANAALEKAYQAAIKGSDKAQRIKIMATRALGQAMAGNAETAFSWIDEALDLAIREELPEEVTYVYRRMANVHEYSGNFEAYLDLELKALDRCQASGGGDLEQACLSCLSYAFFRCGHWKRCQEMLRLLLDELGIEGELKMLAVAVRVALSALRGERRLAETNRKLFYELLRLHGGVYMQFHVHWTLGVLAHLEGDEDTAFQEFAGLIDLWRETEDRHDAVPGLLAASAFYADVNKHEKVAGCVDILNKICSENNNRGSLSARFAAMAEGAWMQGKIDDAIELATQALKGCQEQNTPIEIALVSRRLGKMYISKGETKRAEEMFQEAGAIARKLGMRPLLDALGRDRLTTTPSKETAIPAAPGLTSRQKEVLRLMSNGLTNKEVAAKLSLSPRTVEMHVGSVLERLNCRARTEAIKKGVELGLV